VASLYGAQRNDSAYGVNLRWAADKRLTIEYLKARQEELTNSGPEIAGEHITVTLKSGIEDPGAPPGGMLWNLQHYH
jgi:hypothetical protein